MLEYMVSIYNFVAYISFLLYTHIVYTLGVWNHVNLYSIHTKTMPIVLTAVYVCVSVSVCVCEMRGKEKSAITDNIRQS